MSKFLKNIIQKIHIGGEKNMGIKAAFQGLGAKTKAAFIFLAAIIPPVIVWLTEVPQPSYKLLGAALLGGVLAFIVKMLDEQ